MQVTLEPKTSSRAEDWALVLRARDGDESAYTLLVEKYAHRVRGKVSAILRSQEDVDEIVQDAFSKAYRSLGKFRGDAAFYTWLHRIATNLAINRLHFNRRRASHRTDSTETILNDEGLTIGDTLVDPSKTPQLEADYQEMEGVIAQTMRGLRDHERAILELRVVEDLDYEQISARTGLNVGTVKSRLNRARLKLQESITKIGAADLLKV